MSALADEVLASTGGSWSTRGADPSILASEPMSARPDRSHLHLASPPAMGDEDTMPDASRVAAPSPDPRPGPPGGPSGPRGGVQQPQSGDREVGAPPDDELPVCSVGEHYGAIEIRRFVTRGGMGEVYEGHHPHMDQRLALKVLRKHYRDRPDFVERFRDEGRLLAAICQKEPNVVQIRDVGFDPRCGPFITMEWLDGKNFAELIDAWGGAIPVAQAVHLAIKVANVTHRVHRLGLVHRDLKPANLFLERVEGGEPRLVLLDLGISKRIGGERTTGENRTLGTIDYMAPEQIQYGKATAQSDVYACGLILFEMLSGDHPFGPQAREALCSGGEHQRQLVMMGGHLYGTIEPLPDRLAPRAITSDGRELSLSAVVARATAREPEDRWPSMEAYATALREWLAAHRNPGRKPSAEPARIDGLRDVVAAPASAPGMKRATLRFDAPQVSSPQASPQQPPQPPQPLEPIESVEMSAMVSACSLLVTSRDRPELPPRRYPILRAVTRVGRERGQVDIVLDHTTLSRVHCELRHAVPGLFQVVDLGSSNGLFIDGLPTRAGLLRHGQELRLGEVILRLANPGGWRRTHDGREVFVASALELPPHERATVRMIGDAANPVGKILPVAQLWRPAVTPPVSRPRPPSRPTQILAPARRILYILALAALVLVGLGAVFRLGGYLRDTYGPVERAK